jgi:hypothetical protein
LADRFCGAQDAVAIERSQPIIFDKAPDQSAGECQTCQNLVWTNYQDAGYWNRHTGEYQPNRNCSQGHYDDPLDSPESEEAIGQPKHGSEATMLAQPMRKLARQGARVSTRIADQASRPSAQRAKCQIFVWFENGNRRTQALVRAPCPASACFRLSPSSRHRARPTVRSGTGPGTDIGSRYPQVN